MDRFPVMAGCWKEGNHFCKFWCQLWSYYLCSLVEKLLLFGRKTYSLKLFNTSKFNLNILTIYLTTCNSQNSSIQPLRSIPPQFQSSVEMVLVTGTEPPTLSSLSVVIILTTCSDNMQVSTQLQSCLLLPLLWCMPPFSHRQLDVPTMASSSKISVSDFAASLTTLPCTMLVTSVLTAHDHEWTKKSWLMICTSIVNFSQLFRRY